MKLIKQAFFTLFVTLFLTINSSADCSFELFTISSTKDTRIIDFVEQLSDECKFSIIVTDTQANRVLKSKLNKTYIKNLTINEVLSIILNENNLSYTLEDNMLKISYLTTKIFSIDYVLSQRKGVGSTDITLSSQSNKSSTKKSDSPSSTSQSGIKIESNDEVKFWQELDVEFQSILNRPEDTYIANRPIINKNAGLVTVTATAKQMKRFSNYLSKLQNKVQLLSVTMSDSKTTGIDWKQLYALQNMKVASSLNYNSNSDKSTTGIVDMQLSASINEVIKFLQTQGDVNAISNPKVLTLNNQPALITAGTEYFYKLTSTETLANGTSGTQNTNEDIQSVFAGVLLSITPEIADDNTITLIINPSLSETNSDISQESNINRNMPPDLNRRQLSSVVTVKDGNKIILGGLINTKNTKKVNKVPILGDIPLVNYLFKYEENVKVVQELVMIIEPHIIKKEHDTLSLSHLGYEGLSDALLDNSNKIK